MYHPMYAAYAADAHRKNALRQAEVRRMLRASRQSGKRAGTRRDDGSSVAWRNLASLRTS
jgi:hypothetical protein